MRYALIFAWAAGLTAAEYDPLEVLNRATRKVLASVKDIPNYTCVETVTRVYFDPVAKSLPRDCSVLLEQRTHRTADMVLRPFSTDRLRLDVTMASHGEIYSWSGASRFEDAGIDQVVRGGPIGTGSFAGFLTAVFDTDVKKYKFDGSNVADGRVRLGYSFQVAKADSHYKVKMLDSWAYVSYNGTFWVDAETADVVSLTIATSDVPPATGVCTTFTTMEFERVRIGDGEFLLPRWTRERFVYPNVEETENTTGFRSCREFLGNSTVTFLADAEAVTEGAAAGNSAKDLSLPDGLRFAIALTAPISFETAAAGDPFSAKLVDPIRHGLKVLAPRGTVLEGHLLRVQSFVRPPETLIVLRPEALRIYGTRVPLKAMPDWTRVKKGAEIFLPLKGEDNAGVFRFSGEQVVAPAGFRSEWKTVSQR